MVSSPIREHLEELTELCIRCSVHRLDLFGSATTERFDDATSDLDFLVEFEPVDPKRRARAYFDLLFGLEELFGRSVDLVEQDAIQNPFFREAVDESRVPIYAAA